MINWEPQTYGDEWADEYDSRFAHLTDTEPAVEVLADLAAEGPILELGVGTGRLALPLVALGFRVDAVEASARMIAQLKSKQGGNDVTVVADNFASFRVGEKYSLVYISCNTLFDLPSQSAQMACVSSAARHLRKDGVFVVEASVPNVERFQEGRVVRVVKATDSGIVLDAITHYPTAQQTHRHRILLSADGIAYKSVRNRYIWPSELDLMAQLAGLRLRARWSGWERGEFGDTSAGHVSIFELDE